MGPAIPYIGAFIKAIFVGIGASSILAGSVGWALAVNIARIGALALIAKLTAPKLSISDVALRKTVTIRDPIAPQKFIYGEDLVSGPIIFSNTSGTDNKDLNIVIALVGHEIDSVVKYRIDSQDIPLSDLSGSEDGTFDTGFFAGTGQVDIRKGTTTQLVIADLTATFPTLFNAAHTGQGWSLMNWKFQLIKGSEDVYKNQPQNIRALVRGYKLYDPRLDSTVPGGTGLHRVNDPATWAWSDNPALCLGHFIIDAKFGMKEETDRVDWEMVQTAADICDELVPIPVAATQARYTCNVTFESTMQRLAVRDELLGSMMGRMVFSQGKWMMWAGAAITSDVDLTEANLLGAITLETGASSRDRYNRVRGKHVDAAKDYVVGSYPEARSSAYVTSDGGEVLPIVADFTSANNFFEAQRKSIITLKQSRNQRIAVFQGNFSCFRIQAGSVVTITIDEYGFAGEKFFVTEWKLSAEGVELTLVQEVDSVWTEPLEGDYATRTATGVLTFTNTGVPAPTALTAVASIEGVTVAWTDPIASMYDHIEIWASDENVRSTAVVIATRAQSPYIEPIILNTHNRYYWVRAINISGIASAYEPNLTTTTATAQPLPLSNTVLVDPDFELSTVLDTAIGPQTFWQGTSTQTGTGTVPNDFILQTTGGANGGGAVDLIIGNYTGGGAGGHASIESVKRHSFNSGAFDWAIKYKTNVAFGAPTVSCSIIARAYVAAEGGSFVASSSITFDLPSTGGVYTDVILHTDADVGAPTAQYWTFEVRVTQIPGQNGINEFLRLDSVFVYPSPPSFGTQVNTGKISPGVVPEADVSADSSKFLRGDGTWQNPGNIPQINTRLLFSSSTVAADPGSGVIRYNSGTLASVTAVYISSTDIDANDIDSLLSFVAQDNRFYFVVDSQPTRAGVFEVSAAPTDNGGWWTFPVTVVGSDTLPANNDVLTVAVHFNVDTGTGTIALGGLSDVDTTGAINNDLLVRVGGIWVDTAGLFTWDGANLSALNIGGITEGNLVDKLTNEAIPGDWRFQGAMTVDDRSGSALRPGFRNPTEPRIISASTTMLQSDEGQIIRCIGAGGYTVTMGDPLERWTTITIKNVSSSPINIAENTGTFLIWLKGGSMVAGNRILDVGSLCTVQYDTISTGEIWGNGLT